MPEWPYNFGWKLNLQKVINRSFLAEGNGLTWEVRGNTGHKKVDTRKGDDENTKEQEVDMYWVSGMLMDMERQQSQPLEVIVRSNLTYDRLLGQ